MHRETFLFTFCFLPGGLRSQNSTSGRGESNYFSREIVRIRDSTFFPFSPLETTSMRRERLRDGWYFECECERYDWHTFGFPE